MEAMLAQNLNVKQVDKYVLEENYWFQQKLDGVRLLLHIEDGKVTGINRRQNEIEVPAPIKCAFADFTGSWVIDGEYLNRTFWMFDLPLARDRIGLDTDYRTRYLALEMVGRILVARTPQLQLLPTAATFTEKAALFGECKSRGAEGLMVRDASGLYVPGKRSCGLLKAKFVKTADCIILEVGVDGKRSIRVGLIDDGEIVEVGKVTITEANLTQASVGDVIEARYLYATQERKLYQPAFLRFRPDKPAIQCSIDQLQFTDKTVIV